MLQKEEAPVVVKMGAVLLGLLLFSSSFAFATTEAIPELSFKEALESSDNVFIGRVKSFKKIVPSNPQGPDMQVEFDVVKSFKGKKEDQKLAYYFGTRLGNERDPPGGINNPNAYLLVYALSSSGTIISVGRRSGVVPRYPEAKHTLSIFRRCEVSALEAYSEGKGIDEVLEIAQCSKRKKRP